MLTGQWRQGFSKINYHAILQSCIQIFSMIIVSFVAVSDSFIVPYGIMYIKFFKKMSTLNHSAHAFVDSQRLIRTYRVCPN